MKARIALASALVALLTAVAFLPVLENGFVNWDDDRNFLLNHHYRGLGWPELRWMFTTFHMGHYIPLTWLTLAVDYTLWGMRPVGYHLTSLLFHAANAVLLCFLIVRLLALARPAARTAERSALVLAGALGALVFAVHPLRVESVAWATERRDMVSGFFYFLTVLVYLRASASAERGRRWYWLAVALFACAVLSKAMVVSLPAVLLILDVYPLRRLGGAAGWWGASVRRVYAEKLPFAALSLVASVVAVAANRDLGSIEPLERVGLGGRAAVALYNLGVYVAKTAAPLHLSPLYELPMELWPLTTSILLSSALVVAITVLAVALRRRLPALLAVWLTYAITLLPVLGILQAGPQMSADRYTYLPCLGWAVLAGAGVLWCLRAWRTGRLPTRLALSVAALVIAVITTLGAMTWAQTRVWRDSKTLWARVLAVDPASVVAHNNLGTLLDNEGQGARAIEHFEQAIRVRPRFAEAHNNLGLALYRQGRAREAVEHYRRALEIDPDYPEAHLNLGLVLARDGKLDEALAHMRRTGRARSTPAEAYSNVGYVLASQGNLHEAIEYYHRALELAPDLPEAHNNLCLALVGLRRLDDAVARCTRALRLRPGFASAHNNLGLALFLAGKRLEAIEHFREALRLNPGLTSAKNNLEAALRLERQ